MTNDLPQFAHDESAETYHAAEAMSSGGIKRMLRSPAHYRSWRDLPPEPPTPAMQFGTLVHCAILEPDTLESRAVLLPEDAPTRQSKAGREWWDEFTASCGKRIIVKPADWRRLDRLRAVADASPSLQVLLDGCEVERSMAWRDSGVVCKSRPDAYSLDRTRIVDLKTTSDAGIDAFARSIHTYDYHIQASFYRRGALAHHGTMPEWYWIAIETEEPFAISVYRATPKMLTFADTKIDEALATFRKCVAENYWPAYDPSIRDIDLPAWSYRAQPNAEQL